MIHCTKKNFRIVKLKNNYSIEHTTRSIRSTSFAFGSCICFEEQFLSCDSLRPIRTQTKTNTQNVFSLTYTHTKYKIFNH